MSQLRVSSIASNAGTQSVTQDRLYRGAATAWVNWNGTGTVAIRDSYNVSSITDNGVGDYTVNFQTALANANYSIATGVNYDNASNAQNSIATAWASATSSCRVQSKGGGGGGMYDVVTLSATIFGGY